MPFAALWAMPREGSSGMDDTFHTSTWPLSSSNRHTPEVSRIAVQTIRLHIMLETEGQAMQTSAAFHGQATQHMHRLVTILLFLFVAVPSAGAQPMNLPGVDGHPNRAARPLFSDEFTSLSLHGIWQRQDKWQLVAPDSPQGRGGANFREGGDQWWTNPFNSRTPVPGANGAAPLYQIDRNGLKLGLLSAPPASQSYVRWQCGCANMKYFGALLNSSRTYLRKFGYVEMQVAVDRLPGFTFQADEEAQPISPVWPPEIDFPIIYTDANGVQWMKIQVNERDGKTQTYTMSSMDGFDSSVMHTYGVDWRVKFITFYVDSAQVFQVPTPTDGSYTYHSMYWYLLTGANYQQTNPVDPNPAHLPVYAHIRYFRAYVSRPQSTDLTKR